MVLLADNLQQVKVQAPDGHWYCKKPEKQLFLKRLKDAWLVLKGVAEAVIFKI